MNSRQKGLNNENKAKKELLSEGWLVYRVPPSRMWQIGEDIFGLWDILAYRGGEIKLIQVRTNKKGDFKKHLEFAENNHYKSISCELWVWRDRKGWQKHLLW